MPRLAAKYPEDTEPPQLINALGNWPSRDRGRGTVAGRDRPAANWRPRSSRKHLAQASWKVAIRPEVEKILGPDVFLDAALRHTWSPGERHLRRRSGVIRWACPASRAYSAMLAAVYQPTYAVYTRQSQRIRLHRRQDALHLVGPLEGEEGLHKNIAELKLRERPGGRPWPMSGLQVPSGGSQGDLLNLSIT